MRYPIYILLLYLFLPFNFRIDLIVVLIFYIILNENERFAIVFAFFSGLLIDLYNPVILGLNTLIYTLLTQVLIYLKKYIAKDVLTTSLTFVSFYVVKLLAVNIAFLTQFKIVTIIITIMVFLPVFLLLNKMLFRVWMKQ